MSLTETFAGLDRIDWAAMTHAYGSAKEVPDLLRNLVSGDSRQREIALDGMYGAVHHQGDVYACTLAAIPFLLRIAAAPGLPGRADVLRLVASIGSAEQPEQPVDRRGMRHAEAAEAVAEACPALLRLLADPEPEVRTAVSEVLPARRSDCRSIVANAS
ncbi:hypothetical protein [Amycolatopsis sacchari]|uniref:HEAT repeat-containing protein n=1 Tax=Amycolatopsis sacchari TaxID=115433 RepID=A0A1I3UQ83_9PSEU|nr:hypothetical protein [Amycolatopsis sacchari]SFJ84021.1 hypothetical protein SAMN05421835_109134 [Amycolatopsis sacchari]